MEEELARLTEKNNQAQEEIKRLTDLIEDLRRQLKQAIDGNEELRKLLIVLQAKLDVLIVQTKKDNKKKHGKTTEKHNPRPAPASHSLSRRSRTKRLWPRRKKNLAARSIYSTMPNICLTSKCLISSSLMMQYVLSAPSRPST